MTAPYRSVYGLFDFLRWKAQNRKQTFLHYTINMSNSDHIVSVAEPNTDSYSLQEKVQLFLAACEQLKKLEQSKGFLSDQNWANRLGSEEELQHAHPLLKQNVERWATKFKQDDIALAQKTGLLRPEDLKELKAISAKIELQKNRETGKSKDNSGHQK